MQSEPVVTKWFPLLVNEIVFTDDAGWQRICTTGLPKFGVQNETPPWEWPIDITPFYWFYCIELGSPLCEFISAIKVPVETS